MIHSEREKSMRSSESRVEERFDNVHSEALAIESSEARVKFIAYIDDGKRDTSLHIMPCVQSYAVQYFDAYMQQLPLPTATKSNASTLPTVDFRLLGQAALFISSKVHTSGLDYMDLDDVIDIDRNYSRNDVIEMEKHLLSSIGYKLFPSIPQVTASLFLQQVAATSTIKDHVLIQVEELLHHAMCTPTMLSAHNSFSIGAAAVLVALKDTFENHLQEQHYYNQEKSILICRNAFLEYESIYERTRRKEQRDTVRKDPSRKRRRQLGSIRLEDEVKAGKYSKRRRSNVAVIIVRIVSISSFLFYCLFLNHSFSTNPNMITNCFQLFSFYLQLYKLHLLLLSRYFDSINGNRQTSSFSNFHLYIFARDRNKSVFKYLYS